MTTTETKPDGQWPLRTVEVASDSLLAVRRDALDTGGHQPAVFVHGLGGSSLNWLNLAAELRGTVSPEIPDLPGFGRTPPPHDGDYSISAHCRAIEGLIVSLRRGPVHLFGNSMGGAVATRLAARRPDLVRSLTLISPALPDRLPQRTAVPTALMAVPGFAKVAARATRGLTVEQRTSMSINLTYGDPGSVTGAAYDDAVEEYRRRMGLPYMTDAFIRSARAVVHSYLERGLRSLWQQAREVTVPTLLVYGTRDKLVAARNAQRAAKAFPASQLIVVPDSGHVAMLEHPRVVARAFRELLREVPPVVPAPLTLLPTQAG